MTARELGGHHRSEEEEEEGRREEREGHRTTKQQGPCGLSSTGEPRPASLLRPSSPSGTHGPGEHRVPVPEAPDTPLCSRQLRSPSASGLCDTISAVTRMTPVPGTESGPPAPVLPPMFNEETRYVIINSPRIFPGYLPHSERLGVGLGTTLPPPHISEHPPTSPAGFLLTHPQAPPGSSCMSPALQP